jgi:hypothetical protein
MQAQQEAHLFLHMEREMQRQALQKVRTQREQNVANARATLWRSRCVTVTHAGQGTRGRAGCVEGFAQTVPCPRAMPCPIRRGCGMPCPV